MSIFKKVFAAVFVIALLVGCGTPTRSFVSEEGRFGINFPGTPEIQSEIIPTDVGDIEMVTFVYEKTATGGYMVIYSDYPATVTDALKPDALLQESKNGLLASFGLTGATEEEEVTLDGYPGVAFKGNTDSFYVDYRLYLVGNRLYQVGFLSDGDASSAEDVAFIDSFVLIK